MIKLTHPAWSLLTLCASAIGLFLSLWIILPGPTLLLLILSVGAPEVSPWLLGCNGVLIGLALRGAKANRVLQIALGCSIAGFLISLLPLSQLPATNHQAAAAMDRAFGAGYLKSLSATVQAQMRTAPFSILDSFRGIADQAIRYTPDVLFAAPDRVPLKLNVYRPPQVGHYPAIVVVHGGAWRSGGPAQNAAFSRYMAARGYVVWSITYRFAPRYKFPAQIEDVQSALAFIQQHAAEYETDLSRIALIGRSAGAHLAMLAAYAPDVPLRALVNYYGPVDLAAGYTDVPKPDPIDTRKVLDSLLGGPPDVVPSLYAQASPIRYITHPLVPSLLIYGGRDHVVQAKYGRALEQRLHSVGTKAAFLEIPWADHAFDTVFNGVSSQLALYYTERFLAWALQ